MVNIFLNNCRSVTEEVNAEIRKKNFIKILIFTINVRKTVLERE